MILFKIATVWLAFDIIILATIWYAFTTIRPRMPQLWRAFICDKVTDAID
ncbi:MAG: hypothetical protein AAF629_30690 [Chloroflexota bacterium]